jgi:type VI protein secretion system component VasF
VRIFRGVCLAVLVVLLSGPLAIAMQPPQTPAATDGFVPANDLPAVEQLPAAPLVIGAYAFFLVLMVGYVWSIASRLNKVEAEMKALEQRSRAR